MQCYKCLTRGHFAWDYFKKSRCWRSTSSSDEEYSSSKNRSGSRMSCVKATECKESGNEKPSEIWEKVIADLFVFRDDTFLLVIDKNSQ